MYPGMIVIYTVRPLLKIPITWVTEITHVAAPCFFVDEQRFGPYRFWHHEHHFREVGGEVEMQDNIHYALPRVPLAEAFHPIVRIQLKQIFDFRRKVLANLFGTHG